MIKTPKSLRLQIALFGRTNVGKSSFLNMVAGQDVAITSPIPGTTTDVVEKPMELLPIGPVVFLDTAGLDDTSLLSRKRIAKTEKIFDRADIILLLTEPDTWTSYEETIAEKAKELKSPLIIIINKSDIKEASSSFLSRLNSVSQHVLCCSSTEKTIRDRQIYALKESIISICPDDFLNPPPIINDIVKKDEHAVFIIPIDIEAPKGRIILPQVQAVRDILDGNAIVSIVKETEYKPFLSTLAKEPRLVVCDSQVVDRMVTETPPTVACTTFSILFSRYKGDLLETCRGAAALKTLSDGDTVLIAEACSHHPMEDDIGRVKIPKWLKKYTGRDLIIEAYAGRDYPQDLSKYSLIIHCGACMITRREMLSRIHHARSAGVPITNYGVCISALHGVLERVLEVFPEAYSAYSVPAKNTFHNKKFSQGETHENISTRC